ncbi:hypothetical protein C8F04DRAFT_1181003 [Mycena alexandri]|uniref:Uncharacterized protein n=1 Tax=Mycena alexandri TaxID=1745969 RepID=A0AAD6T487_9AGAR|nr:hypothetical protein C8F04DRAFT_1181003 [Mycena alexandri]
MLRSVGGVVDGTAAVLKYQRGGSKFWLHGGTRRNGEVLIQFEGAYEAGRPWPNGLLSARGDVIARGTEWDGREEPKPEAVGGGTRRDPALVPNDKLVALGVNFGVVAKGKALRLKYSAEGRGRRGSSAVGSQTSGRASEEGESEGGGRYNCGGGGVQKSSGNGETMVARSRRD